MKGIENKKVPPKYILNKAKILHCQYNFKKLGDIDISELINNLENVKESDWVSDGVRNKMRTHSKIHTLPIRWKPESLGQGFVNKIENNDWYDSLNFKKLENELLSIYKKHYGDGFIHKIILANMPPNWSIQEHMDSGPSLMLVHRTHIPIITNEFVTFYVGNESKKMLEGEVWEINNAQYHSVTNEGLDWRLHLIVDYYPYKGLSQSQPEKTSLF